MRLLILGGGSAAISAARAIAARGGSVVMVHDGLPLGGSCLHVGCVPSKYLIRAAAHVHACSHPRFPGITPAGAEVNTSALLADLRALIAELRRRNYEDSLPHTPGVRLIRGHGRLRNARCVEVNGERFEGDAVLIATGSRSDLSAVNHLPNSLVLSNETLFSRDSLPKSVIVLGGGYIALELGQMLHRFGSRVTLLQRSARVLSRLSPVLGETLGDLLRAEGLELHVGVQVESIEAERNGVTVRARIQDEPREFHADQVLVARGRLGNTDGLGLEALGIETDSEGFIRVDQRLETACPGVYAAGDVLGGHMLVYTASAEAERVVERLYGSHPAEPPPEHVPWVVFTDPQVAGIGWDVDQARARGIPADEAVLPVNRWPRFSTAREHRGFLRLIRDPRDDTLVGARILCPEGGDLLTELSLILQHHIPLAEVAKSTAPYLTLPEGIGLCASRFAR